MAHEPVAQVGVALARAHAVMQPLQCTSVLSACSQPFALLPSQSPNPGEQDVAMHVPVVHVSPEPAMSQTVPHVAQLARVFSGVSQPFAGIVSQLPQSELQAPSVHVPVAQLAIAFAREQLVPQVAQLVSVVSDVSQPFASVASQLP